MRLLHTYVAPHGFWATLKPGGLCASCGELGDGKGEAVRGGRVQRGTVAKARAPKTPPPQNERQEGKQRQGGGGIHVPPTDTAVLEILCSFSTIRERKSLKLCFHPKARKTRKGP